MKGKTPKARQDFKWEAKFQMVGKAPRGHKAPKRGLNSIWNDKTPRRNY